MTRRKRRHKKWHEPSHKARERLHAMRMKFKPGYADAYLKSLGLTDREIAIHKSFGENIKKVIEEKKRQGW